MLFVLSSILAYTYIEETLISNCSTSISVYPVKLPFFPYFSRLFETFPTFRKFSRLFPTFPDFPTFHCNLATITSEVDSESPNALRKIIFKRVPGMFQSLVMFTVTATCKIATKSKSRESREVGKSREKSGNVGKCREKSGNVGKSQEKSGKVGKQPKK